VSVERIKKSPEKVGDVSSALACVLMRGIPVRNRTIAIIVERLIVVSLSIASLMIAGAIPHWSLRQLRC
jgi:hypothetical protein